MRQARDHDGLADSEKVMEWGQIKGALGTVCEGCEREREEVTKEDIPVSTLNR